MRAIKSELEALQGRPIFYEELAHYAGQAVSSVFDKLQKSNQPQIEALFGWIERLPESTRNQLINEACRCYPTLESPRLRYDSVQLSHLKTLLRQTSGFTIIQGGSDGLRTFVVTALGHSWRIHNPERLVVWGIDVHEPDWFVPVEGVVSLHNLLDPTSIRECVHRHWPTLTATAGQLVILNGIWSGVQGLEEQIVELGARSHVLVADDSRFKLESLARRAQAPTHILSISEEKDNRIRVTVQQL
jgi:hypothetical protein